MNTNRSIWIALPIAAISFVPPIWASDDMRRQHGQHMHGELHGNANNPCSIMDSDTMGSDIMKSGEKMAAMPGSFMKTVLIDGFDVTFHIMRSMKGMSHGGSHNVMIKVEKSGETFTDLLVNSKVTHPNKVSESKMMMKMGDWYMASYDLEHPGRHQVMVLFKMSDGTKHFGGIDFVESAH
ncbi:MAG: hypothetical protein Q9M13_07570 [Mariprofundales bacterium]|nr:hypothetical protein [Mariprofundales bacterium]